MDLKNLPREKQHELADWIAGGGFHEAGQVLYNTSTPRSGRRSTSITLCRGILEAADQTFQEGDSSQQWKDVLIATLDRSLKACGLQVVPTEDFLKALLQKDSSDD